MPSTFAPRTRQQVFLSANLEHMSDERIWDVIIVGGGAVMDAVGLAAALVHRGLRQVRAVDKLRGDV